MATEAQQRLERAMANSSARKTLAEFLRERYERRVNELMSCNKETFERQQGKALELKELIDYITGIKGD